MAIPSIPKKLPFSLQSKPFVFMNKKIDINSNNNNNNNKFNANNKQYITNHNLSKFSQKKNSNNIPLLEKIKDKVYKENKESIKISKNINESVKEKKIINENNMANILKNNKKMKSLVTKSQMKIFSTKK